MRNHDRGRAVLDKAQTLRERLPDDHLAWATHKGKRKAADEAAEGAAGRAATRRRRGARLAEGSGGSPPAAAEGR
jgi:hypothetical protein